MANSDQDSNDSQSSAEVEDPITNPGKRETTQAEKEVSPAAVSKPKNNKRIMIATVVVMLIAIGFFIAGGSEQASGPIDTVAGGTQVPADNLPAEMSENTGNEGGEFSDGGEGGLPVAGDNRPPSNSEGAESDGGLDSIRLDTDISADSNEELIAEITEMLLLSGLISPDDVLSISSETEVNGNRVIRLEQAYSGIPVFGGVIVAIENDDVVFNLSGEMGSGIEVDIEPELSFEEALVVANQSLSMTASSRSGVAEAQLYIIKVEELYHLAWYGVVVIDGSEERVFLDAHDGSVLQRLPVNTGEA